MPKPRSIDPLFWDDEDINLLSRDERLLIVGMVTVFADDEGRLIADPNALRKRLFADDRDVTTATVVGWLGNIARIWKNFKLYYVRDRQYAWFASWDRWQPMKYKAKSKLPEFEEALQSNRDLSKVGKILPNSPTLATGRDGWVGLGSVGLGSVESVESVGTENLPASQISEAPEDASRQAPLPPISTAKPNGKVKPFPETREAIEARLVVYEFVKNSLVAYPGADQLPGKPDDAIVKRCLEIGGWARDPIEAALKQMAFAYKRPTVSWAWFPTVLAQYFEARDGPTSGIAATPSEPERPEVNL